MQGTRSNQGTVNYSDLVEYHKQFQRGAQFPLSVERSSSAGVTVAIEEVRSTAITSGYS